MHFLFPSELTETFEFSFLFITYLYVCAQYNCMQRKILTFEILETKAYTFSFFFFFFFVMMFYQTVCEFVHSLYSGVDVELQENFVNFSPSFFAVQ